jgi:4-hydroxy-tetrahydrodipicolinate synthase
MIANGCRGLVCCGSLGESNTLTFAEKIEVIGACAEASPEFPVIAGIAGLTTQEAVHLGKEAVRAGARGLMVLPPYVYAGDAREMNAHVSAVIEASGVSCMLYNNPIAYRVDFRPEQVATLCNRHENLLAIKESSGDIRRLAALSERLGDRLQLGVGIDDALVEGVAMGASFWVAGLVNAFPRESVALFELARAGEFHSAMRLYHWFLPLLRLDTIPSFVSQIKFITSQRGWGHERVRLPRMPLEGTDREHATAILDQAMAALESVTTPNQRSTPAPL